VVFICFSHESGYWFLACLLVVPAAVLLVRSVAVRIQTRMRQGMESASDLNSIAVENLQSAREVRAYGLQEREAKRFNQASQEGLRIQGKLVRYENDHKVGPCRHCGARLEKGRDGRWQERRKD
jgi:subfamily B ATP-binding cassette protein MsbA